MAGARGRVGIGLKELDLRTIREKLEGNLVEAGGRRPVPRCYITVGSRDDTPNVWVKDPTKSVVLQVLIPIISFRISFITIIIILFNVIMVFIVVILICRYFSLYLPFFLHF